MDTTYKITLIAILAVVFLLCKGIYDERQYRRRLYKRLEETWGKPARQEYTYDIMENIKCYYNSISESNSIDDITCNDLNMDAVYGSINHTKTSIGEEYLYALLRRPCTDISILNERERVIKLISNAGSSERIKLEAALAGMGRLDKIPVYQYFEKAGNMESENKWYHICCGLALAVSMLLCFVKPAVFVLVSAIVIIYNVLSYYKSKAKLDSYIQIFAFITRAGRQSEEIANAGIAGLEKYQERLLKCASSLKKLNKNSWIISGGGMGGSIADSLMDYIRILFHIDLIKICSMADGLQKHRKELMGIFEIAGYIDSMVSIASFRAGLDSWCIPELDSTSGKKSINMEFVDLYHPLIEKPVKNSITTDRGILITGSNASGKSVFIKTVAVNAIFAQTIHTVLAKKYSSCFYHVYSSMALRDDIFSSESYYIVEIKSLKRILDRAAEADIPVLCFIDEVLRGTNTLERIASSSEILKQIAKLGAMCFAATHDLELAKILAGYYNNYHFEETVTEDNVIFDYKLRKGSTKTRNAIKLLNMTGYDKSVTLKAEEAAQYFLENGVWRT